MPIRKEKSEYPTLNKECPIKKFKKKTGAPYWIILGY